MLFMRLILFVVLIQNFCFSNPAQAKSKPSSSPFIKLLTDIDLNLKPELTCLKPFIYIDEFNHAELKTFLAAHPECVNLAQYEGRNYQTFALEKQNIEAIKMLIDPAGGKDNLSRVFATDKRGKSLYSMIREEPKKNREYAKLFYDFGLDKKLVVDLAWEAGDAALVADLYFIHSIKAKDKNQYEYEVYAVRDGFGSLIREFLNRDKLDLKKLYKFESDQPMTLLEIAFYCQLNRGSPFDLELIDLYVEKGMLLDANGHFEQIFLINLEKLRNQNYSKPENIQHVDQFHIKLATLFPEAWIYFVDRTFGDTRELNRLFSSIVSQGKIPLSAAIPALFSKLPAPAVFPLIDKSFQFQLEPQKFSEALSLLAKQNRFGSEQLLKSFIYNRDTKLDLAATVQYLAGVEKKFFAVPQCSAFYNERSLSISTSDIDRLISFGMDPKPCGAAIDKLLQASVRFEYSKLFYLAKLSGSVTDALMQSLLKEEFNVIDKELVTAGITDLAATWFKDPKNIPASGDICEKIKMPSKEAAGKIINGYGLNLTECISRIAIDSSKIPSIGIFELDLNLTKKLVQERNLSQWMCRFEKYGNKYDMETRTKLFELDPVECWKSAVVNGGAGESYFKTYAKLIKKYYENSLQDLGTLCSTGDYKVIVELLSPDDRLAKSCLFAAMERPYNYFSWFKRLSLNPEDAEAALFKTSWSDNFRGNLVPEHIMPYLSNPANFQNIVKKTLDLVEDLDGNSKICLDMPVYYRIGYHRSDCKILIWTHARGRISGAEYLAPSVFNEMPKDLAQQYVLAFEKEYLNRLEKNIPEEKQQNLRLFLGQIAAIYDAEIKKAPPAPNEISRRIYGYLNSKDEIEIDTKFFLAERIILGQLETNSGVLPVFDEYLTRTLLCALDFKYDCPLIPDSTDYYYRIHHPSSRDQSPIQSPLIIDPGFLKRLGELFLRNDRFRESRLSLGLMTLVRVAELLKSEPIRKTMTPFMTSQFPNYLFDIFSKPILCKGEGLTNAVNGNEKLYIAANFRINGPKQIGTGEVVIDRNDKYDFNITKYVGSYYGWNSSPKLNSRIEVDLPWVLQGPFTSSTLTINEGAYPKWRLPLTCTIEQ